ncbi:carboxypeptidase-like regulatory domain-containing protein [Pedobacter cryotolerans]|uniref:Carboxypeptidase-like regulatory domain-containing protein n=1 Tax=Pedobacter cryotolerans TaxID=2571270 RepID=A0A4U1CA89_9SPHI|nr:carboxypeptidase-like regulatory domain-containing protein [Pedobacter cryotolerans]TKC01369.1 carboxypeptidase-like regulatory domain-containing protein [Pedobacter cryotolerans]
MRTLFFIILFLGIGFSSANAQKQIKGKIKNQKGDALSAVSVNLKDKEGTILSFTRTDDKGNFTLNFKENASELSIEASIIGYVKKSTEVTDLGKLYELQLQESEINLKTVVVKNRPSLVTNGDTLNYKTADFADKQDRTIGDVIKKMPGIEVAENGKVTYNGKGISNLYLDGDNVLDDKYNIATKSIPHGAVDKVQVIEKDQPIKMLRKNNTSDDIALNLVIKDDAKMKLMGDIKAGLGTPDRYDGNINGMMFNKKSKFINNIKGNNINVDPAVDLTSHNMGDYLRRLENDKPSNFLSAGAAGVPTLPPTRTLFNNAGLANFNTLYKFNPDLQLRANVAYLYDQRDQIYNKFSETYLSGETISYNEAQINAVNPQKLQAQFTLNNNTKTNYLNNVLLANYVPNRTNSMITINGIGAGQELYQQNFDLSNEFSFRKKFKSDDILHFYSYVNRSTQPEILNIRPGLNEDILNNGVPFAGLDQYVKLPTWYTNNYVSFAVVNNKFTSSFKTGFNWQKQELNSELFSIQNDQSTALVSPDMTNSLNWFKTKIYTEGNFDYTTEKFKATLNVPLSYNTISYNDASKSLDQSLNKFFVNPAVNFRYQTSIENYVTANYAFKNGLGGLDDIYQGTILKNYRSLFSNNAPISERKTHSAGAQFNYRKAIQMFFFNVNIGYSNTTLNTISSFTLTNNIQQRVVLPLLNSQQNFTFGANTSKYLFNLRSTVNFGISYNNSQFDQLQNNELLPFTAQAITYKAGIDAKITNFLNWAYNANYTVSSNQSPAANNIKNNNQQLRQQTDITATAFKSVFINFSAEHIFTQQSNQPNLSYLFADFNVRYKLMKLKTDLEFGITNLANIKEFQANFLSSNSFTTGTYLIPGRVAMMKATFNF